MGAVDLIDLEIADLTAQIQRDLSEDSRNRATAAARHLRQAIDAVNDLAQSPDMSRVAELLSEAADILQGRIGR